jgi:hypothetical protein
LLSLRTVLKRPISLKEGRNISRGIPALTANYFTASRI